MATTARTTAAPAIVAPLFARPRFIHLQVTPVQFLAVELFNGPLAFLTIRHLDETETT